jgi:hypothetical protein
MHKKKSIISIICIVFSLILVSTININSIKAFDIISHETPPYLWNDDWSYNQEINIPIKTSNIYSKYQPIDLRIKFENNCWAKNESHNSIRICCWLDNNWYELESQIYNLNFSKDNIYITDCRIVFLIPDFANGYERYFIYYDDSEKPKNNYIDHIQIEDAYYYFEPITGISVEGDYYKIIEDGVIVYGIGQKGQVMNRKLSQIVIKLKPDTKEFDIMQTELLASFSFSYHQGPDDDDEVSSDQVLISKEIFVDGNLMTEFGIISESNSKNLRSTNVYKYYYCPNDNKKIIANVKHEVFDEVTVKGVEEIDGRYGGIISYKSKSSSLKKMVFGDILPFLHIYGDDNRIKEYKMNINPETKDREWIISHHDDCDLGDNAWISYDMGENGKSHGIIFSSNDNIIKQGDDERDGIEIKVSEREYLNIVGTEIDYASIGFGRNSFIENGDHDLIIPNNLIVEFTAEFLTIEEEGYGIIDKEAEIFHKLIRYYDVSQDDKFEGHDNIYTLTIIPHLSGKVLSYPNLINITKYNLPIIFAELYQNDTLLSSSYIQKPIIGRQLIKFPKLSPGLYKVKIYRKFGNNTNYIGFGSTYLDKDINLHIYCTWESRIVIDIYDQNKKNIENAELIIFKDNLIVNKIISGYNNDNIELLVPFNLFDNYEFDNINNFSLSLLYKISQPYVLKCYYKGFLLYEKDIKISDNNIEIELNLNDLTVELKDKIGFSPGVELNIFLTSKDMIIPVDILPIKIGNGKYLFEKLPSANYELNVLYGSFSDKKSLIIPDIGNFVNMKFNALYNLNTKLYNSHGENIIDNDLELIVLREGSKIFEDISIDDTIIIPPGKYTVNVYEENQLIGSKTIDLINDKNINIVTIKPSLITIIISILSFTIIGLFVIFLMLRKISTNSFLKIIAISLIIFSLVQPWWNLNSSNEESTIEKTTQMFIFSYSMVDKIDYNNEIYLDLATIPEEFTEFLVVLLIILYSGLFLMGMSFLPNIILRRRFSLILSFSSILFITLVNTAFTYGMIKITELSLGSIQGHKILDVILPNGDKIYLNSSWGFGYGFYICILSSCILIFAGFIDFFRRKKFF